jgi:hypothetical protein
MFVHMMVLETPERKAATPLARRLGVALTIALGVAAGVTVVFERLFLVRLP